MFFDNTRCDLSEDVVVHGCTVFSHAPAQFEDRVSVGLNDFFLVDNGTVADGNAEHRTGLSWSNDQSLPSCHLCQRMKQEERL